jgi:hypothetical protein
MTAILERKPAAATQRETAVFRAAMGVIAVALIEDAVVFPEPGTSAGDHVAALLVPLLVALVLAWTFPRMHGGTRAAVSVACGTLALVAGIADGFRHVAVARLAGDDATVMLGGVAGAALIVLGVLTLWRSRRLDERRPRRYARRALQSVACVVGAFLVLFPVAFAIVATHRARTPVVAADLGRPYQDVTLTTSDGLRLAGWYVPSRNRAVVIVSPGRTGPVPHARLLARRGFGVLLFDRRGEGRSEGDFNAFGWGGDSDIKAALDFLARRRDVDPERIGGLGLSVGGE